MHKISELADEIGNLRSQIKHLQDRIHHIEDVMKDEQISVAHGEYFRVAISYDVERATTNWKKIALGYKPSYQLVTANTKRSTHDRVSVTAVIPN